jgi:hypothetical protein
MNRSHTKERRWGNTKSRTRYYGTLKEAGREVDLRLAGEGRSSKKTAEVEMNYCSWQLIDRSGESS